jgi:hypothetical protein
MKTLKVLFIFICVNYMLVVNVSAIQTSSRITMKERTDQWLSRSNNQSAVEAQSISAPPKDPEVELPVGDSVFLLLLLSGLYLLWSRKKKVAAFINIPSV